MSERARLLFVSPRFLFPVDSGGKIRTTQVLRGLKGGEFEITLASPAPRGAYSRHRAQLASVCDRFVHWRQPAQRPWFQLARLRHLFGPLPVPVASDRSVGGSRAVASLLDRRPDVVVFDFPHAVVLAPRRLPCASVLFTHNVEAEILERHAKVARTSWKRSLWQDQHRKMVRFERDALRRFDRVIAVSPRDRAHFEREYGSAHTATIGTGVDLEYFTYRQPADGADVIFSGSMDWLANIDAMEFFLEQVWPRVLAAVPQATMTVVGRSPPQLLVDRARRLYPGWKFTGYVDDIRPHLRSAAVSVIPLRVGGGTRLKAFEAMALGCPVVSTAIGVEGLPVEDRRHYLLADSPEDFAGAVVQLLRDREQAQVLAAQARQHVEANFSFRAVARQFELICLDAIRHHRESRRAEASTGALPVPQVDTGA